ncbi:MAG: 3-keto-5-aminohexanoate cleavage protein [Actinomycetota bacterium]|nr:3-keto-5-aminohexanoate cleavage protein [Actinomycetota bacterium]
MDEVMITVAAVGAELSKGEHSGLPATVEELVVDAVRCRDAGAAIYHLHVRDDDGSPTMDVATFERARDAIRRHTDLIVQFTTGGAISDPEVARLAPLELRPEMATLTTGSVNFADEVFVNRLPFVRSLYERMLSLGVLPGYEIFDSGMIATADRLYEELGAEHHRHFDFVLGVPGGMPAWPDSVSFLRAKLTRDSTWSATGIGRAHVGVARAALEAGGHVRTGLEDVTYIEAGVRASSNAQLIERVVHMAHEVGREVASPDDARRMLGLVAR